MLERLRTLIFPFLPPFAPQKLLFERGKESLESEFRSLMTRNSKVVSPVLILDLIGGEEDLELQEEVPLEHLPESVLHDVVRISRWLVEYGRNQGEAVRALEAGQKEWASPWFNPLACL